MTDIYRRQDTTGRQEQALLSHSPSSEWLSSTSVPVVIIHTRTQDLNLCLLVLWYFKTTHYSNLKLVAQAEGLDGSHFVLYVHHNVLHMHDHSLANRRHKMGTPCIHARTGFHFARSPIAAKCSRGRGESTRPTRGQQVTAPLLSPHSVRSTEERESELKQF